MDRYECLSLEWDCRTVTRLHVAISRELSITIFHSFTHQTFTVL